MERVHLQIYGLVQGVFYRASAQTRAAQLGLQGWVRNCSDDGHVEAVAEGARPALEAFVAWCRQGPPTARVDTLEAMWLPATGDFSEFSVVR